MVLGENATSGESGQGISTLWVTEAILAHDSMHGYAPRGRPECSRGSGERRGREVSSIENGGEKSGTGERARICAAALQSLPLAVGDRRLWETYIRRQRGVQGARTGGKGVVRWGGRGGTAKSALHEMRQGLDVPQPANQETSTVDRENRATRTLEPTGGPPSGPQHAVGPRSRGTYVVHRRPSGVASKDALPQKPRGGHPPR